MAGLKAARSRGKPPGRPTVMTPDRIATARIASTLGVGCGSIYRALEPTQ